MSKTPRTLTIPKAWKRRHEIVFRAVFSNDKNNDELEKEVAMNLWKMWMFE